MSPRRPEPKSSTSSATGAEPPIADRIPTPPELDLAAVEAATRAAEEEKQRRAALKSRHMPDCPVHRESECACPANLAVLPPPLEAVRHGDVELIRVDNGYNYMAETQDPTTSAARLVTVERFMPPRWICTSCGAAWRTMAIVGHQCDPSLLLWRARPMPLSLSISAKRRVSGDYRVSIYRDAQGQYHLEELVFEGEKVVARREVSIDPDYLVIEASLGDLMVSEFSP